VVLVLLSAALLAGAIPAVIRLRAHCEKSRAAAASFALPGVLLAGPAVWLIVRGEPVAAAPLLALAALCAGAAAIFAPTAATRFAAFERAFWAYVER
jgi:hypothetical protein